MATLSPLYTTNCKRSLNVWACGCPHCAADTAMGRSSLALAISHIESTRVARVDFGIILGDFSANQNPSELASYATEGADCAAQLNSGTSLTADYIYRIKGNHDDGDNNDDWYDTYIGRVPSNPPYPFLPGATDDYRAIKTGNIVWIFLDDINYGPQPCGRSGGIGGFPSGSTTLAAYNYWVATIEANPGCNIITCAHHSLKDTTIATGDNEGTAGGYHGSSGQAIGSGRLHNVITDVVANTYEADQTRFMDYLATHPGACILWLCAHTHANVGESYAGRTHYHYANGCHFKNVGHLALHHGTSKNTQSDILNFTEGSPTLTINKVLHDTGYQGIGYNGAPITITLPFNYTP